MSDWPSDWPPEVRDFYAGLAAKWNWNSGIIDGVRRNVEYIRSLEEGASPPTFYRSPEIDGEEYFFQAVQDGDDLIAVRQINVNGRGVHRYWWQAREDADGFLTDVELRPDTDELVPISANEFEHRWQSD